MGWLAVQQPSLLFLGCAETASAYLFFNWKRWEAARCKSIHVIYALFRVKKIGMGVDYWRKKIIWRKGYMLAVHGNGSEH
jgi:hypothetical protein